MSPSAPSRSRWTLFLALIALLFSVHVVLLRCVAEDAFISFRFARNLADGHGLLWNLGDPPVEGYTNFLWVLFSAGAIAAGLDVPLMSQVAGTAFGLSTLLLAWRFGRKLIGLADGPALIAPALLAASGPFATWSGSGMETVPFAFFVLLATYLLGSYLRSGSRSCLIGSNVAALLATLTRPEGLMVFCLLGAAGLVLPVAGVPVTSLRQRLLNHLVPALAFLVPFAIYFAWRFNRYGYPLPNTFYAKTGASVGQVKRGLQQALVFLVHFVGPLAPSAILFAWSAGETSPGSVTRRVGWPVSLHGSVRLVLLLIVTVYTAYVILVGGDYMAMHRFFVPLLPLLYLLFASFSPPALASAAAVLNRKRTLAVALAIALAGTLVHSTPPEVLFFAPPPWAHGNYRGVLLERRNVARLTLIGKYFEKLRDGHAASVGTNAIGAISYYSGLDVYDVHGLVDAEIAHAPIETLGSRRPGHERQGLKHILGKRPTWLMLDRSLTKEPREPWDAVPAALQEQVRGLYEKREVWLEDAENHEAGYLTYLELRR